MGYKVNLYSANTGGGSFRSYIENALFDLCIGLVGIVFSVFGYKAEMILVAAPFGLIGLMCLYSFSHTTIYYLKERRDKQKASMHTDESDEI